MPKRPFIPFYDLPLLRSAWQKVQRNQGCAGGDNETLAQFSRRANIILPKLSEDLRQESYAPRDYRRIDIPKKDGTTRPLAVPSVIDRVAMTAATEALSPVLDKTFSDDSFGYRKNKSVQMAVDRVSMLRRNGYRWTVEADIERCFERIPHDLLLAKVDEVLGPKNKLLRNLIGLWVAHAGLQCDTPGRGVPQGSPISPLLSNLYLDQLDESFEDGDARLVRFADDFVILTRSHTGAKRALKKAAGFLDDLGLRLKPSKTGILEFEDSFRFLGHLFVRALALPSRRAEEDDTLLLLQKIAMDDAEAEAQIEEEEFTESASRLLYVTTPGLRIDRHNFSFRVSDAKDRMKMSVSHRRVDRIEVGPDVTVDTSALRLAMRTGTPMSFSNGYGTTIGALDVPDHGNALLHLAQARALDDPERCETIARAIVKARIHNMRSRLHVLNRTPQDVEVTKAIRDLGECKRKLPSASGLHALRGQEGAAAKIYWPALGRLCVASKGRFRRTRPGEDPLNAVINYLTALLSRDIRAATLRTALHPGLGFLHRPSERGDALIYDLMEGFRASFSEGLAVSLFNRRRLRSDMFEPNGASIRIKSAARRAIIAGYEAEIRRKSKSPHTAKRHDGRGRMLWEARALARSLRTPDVPFQPALQDN